MDVFILNAVILALKLLSMLAVDIGALKIQFTITDYLRSFQHTRMILSFMPWAVVHLLNSNELQTSLNFQICFENLFCSSSW